MVESLKTVKEDFFVWLVGFFFLLEIEVFLSLKEGVFLL